MQEIAHAGIGLLAQERADAQVLRDGEAGEDAASLRHDPHPAAGDAMRGHPRHVRAFDADVATCDRGQPDQTAGQCRLADSVATEQGNHLTHIDRERDPLHDRRRTVAEINVVDGEQSHSVFRPR